MGHRPVNTSRYMPTSRLVPAGGEAPVWSGTKLSVHGCSHISHRAGLLSRLPAGLSWRLAEWSSPTRASTGSSTVSLRARRIIGGATTFLVASLSPNPPKDTDGRREDSGRGVRELQGRWPGLHWGRWEVGGRSSVAAQGPYGRLRELRCAGWRENTQQGTLADRGGASLRGRWVSCSLAVRPGVEWLAAGPRRE